MKIVPLESRFPTIREPHVFAVVEDDATYPQGGHIYIVKKSSGFNPENQCTAFVNRYEQYEKLLEPHLNKELTAKEYNDVIYALHKSNDYQIIAFLKKEVNSTMRYGILSESLVELLMHRHRSMQEAYSDDEVRYNRLIGGYEQVKQAMIDRVNKRVETGVMGELKDTPK